MKRHYVTFLSPGTFVHEETTRQIPKWDVSKAVEMSKDILERYNARPFAFVFTTRERKARQMDSKEVARSPRYFLPGGVVRTAAEVLAGTDESERILRSNVEANGMKRVITCQTPWRSTHEVRDDDIVLEAGA